MQQAAAFEVCRLQDPIKYQMHVCPRHNPPQSFYSTVQLSTLDQLSCTICYSLSILVVQIPLHFQQTWFV